MRRLVAACVGLALVTSGCSGGKEQQRAETQPRVDFSSVTENDLALMPLPGAAIGTAARGMTLDPDSSGPRDAGAAAEDSIDPDDTVADIQRSGRLAGYDLTYVDTDLSTARQRRGFVAVATGVELFDTVRHASATLGKNARDYRRLVGKEVEPGVRLARAEVRPLPGVGDEGRLIVSTLVTRSLTLHATVALFRLQTVLVGVVVGRADRQSTTALTGRLARALARRVRGVATGDVKGKPVPIPARERRSQSPPAGAEGLQRLALARADLPRGVKVARQEYVQQGSRVQFVREFGPAVVGRSLLLRVEAHVERAFDTAAARTVVDELGTLLASGRSKEAVRALLGPGADASRVRLRRIEANGVGDRAVAVHVRVPSQGGPLEGVFVYLTSGRVAGQLYAVGGSGTIRPSDVLTLARRFARRMSNG